jgi:putative NIF3 family GTP cyclohydrolase 1 type 2
MCSFNTSGEGTFRGSDESDPFVGKKGTFHKESEWRIETIYPREKENQIIRALLRSHPYEEVAYDIYPLANTYDRAGSGAVGDLEKPMDEPSFLALLKERFDTPVVRHTRLLGREVQRIAICGGSGSFVLPAAKASGADAFVSGDFKYHQFFDADNRILVADIGHYESEQFTKEIFYELLTKKFTKFAVHLSEVNTNPVNYF